MRACKGNGSRVSSRSKRTEPLTYTLRGVWCLTASIDARGARKIRLLKRARRDLSLAGREVGKYNERSRGFISHRRRASSKWSSILVMHHTSIHGFAFSRVFHADGAWIVECARALFQNFSRALNARGSAGVCVLLSGGHFRGSKKPREHLAQMSLSYLLPSALTLLEKESRLCSISLKWYSLRASRYNTLFRV